jgi:hypothetical protein
MSKPTPSEAGRALAALGASKGGKAAAKAMDSDQLRARASAGGKASAARLTENERSQRARKAVQARWKRYRRDHTYDTCKREVKP